MDIASQASPGVAPVSEPEVRAPAGLEPAAVARKHAQFPALDGIRAIAAISVVAFHVDLDGYGGLGPASHLVRHLDGGVALFFLLSGFLLYRPFIVARAEGRRVTLSTYFTRRILRIVPAFWLALFVLSIWPGLYGLGGGRWLADAGFLQIYSQHYENTGLGVAWSLDAEITFYLALPVFAIGVGALIGRLRGRPGFWVEIMALAVIAVGSLAVHTAISRKATTGQLGYTLPSTAYLFCAGMLLAACSVHRGPLLSRGLAAVAEHRLLCWVAALGLFALISFKAGILGPTDPLFVPVAFLMLLPVTLAPSDSARLDRFLAAGVIATLGILSYGIYLWHDPLIPPIAEVLGPVGRFGDGLGLMLATVAAATLAATISYRFLERPALAFAHRRTLTTKR
jgi:peptidoglycan/LPS O-acetylase OafA/YrhL